MTYNKSVIKWAGGKGKALHHIIPILEKHREDIFIEPFMGALNVSINFQGESKYILNDLNKDLVNTFQCIKDSPEDYILACSSILSLGIDYYIEARDKYNNEEMSNLERAAHFKYLNAYCFNGIYRCNKGGSFNVPKGSGGVKNVSEKEVILFNKFLNSKDVKLVSADFEEIFSEVEGLDSALIYADCPYVSLNSNFKYTKDGFGLDKQEKLKQLAKESKHTVIISNHLTPYTEALYSDADEIYTFPVQRTISCDGGGRKQVMEIVAVYK